jgi:tRNA pseudouridine38-40 synthase
MPRYFIHLAYAGTAYHGWQIQPNGVSVQQVLSEAASIALRENILVQGAGRTDTGVHATQFFAHFDSPKSFDKEELAKLCFSLNGLLPDDIAVYEIMRVHHDAHARFSATSRTYEYLITRRRDPFLINRAWYYKKVPHLHLLNAGAAIISSYDDFGCFSKSNTDVKTFRCRISLAHWEQQEHLLRFTITADRFLRNMVRAITGTLIDFGLGRISESELHQIIQSGDRRNAGMSVPAEGLYLSRITYPENIFIACE